MIRVHLPALRERAEDAVLLARHFLADQEVPGRPERFSRGALQRIREHPWPGNVRELRNAVERAALMAATPEIRSEDLDLSGGSPASDAGWSPQLPPPGSSLDDLVRAVVLEALREARFVQKDAAERLGMSRRKLNYMISRMGITHPRWRRHRAPVCEEDAEALDSGSPRLNPRRSPGDEGIGERP